MHIVLTQLLELWGDLRAHERHILLYPEKAYGNQTEEQRHIMFSNLVLKEKLRETVHFVYDREREGGGL